MTEIHAYQNDDGTYRVEILGVALTEQTGKVKTTTESKMEIPRAKVNIIGLPPSNKDEGKYFTITIE